MVGHLVERYGKEEVESWYFEVWNEPDFRTPWIYGFWTGSDQDYFRLYDFAAEAVKAVDPKLRVGGPVAATTRLIEPFLKHVTTENFATGAKSVPLDFLDYHMYFAPPFKAMATALVVWYKAGRRAGMMAQCGYYSPT